MTGFGKLIRTTAFRLVITYLLAFVIFAGLLVGYIAWNARRVMEGQLNETIETEINSLAEQYRQGGPRRLAAVIERRARQARGFIYVLTDPRGEMIAGNAVEIATMRDLLPGWHELSYTRSEDQMTERVFAKLRLFVLPNNFRLVVGHDLDDRTRMRQVLRQAMLASVLLALLLGLIGARVISRRVLRPVEDMTDAASRIMAGNLAERLPVRGVGDEFDRLALHLNLMLNRIGELMTGLREVSDNIAHDLRTPLTRIRAASEEALRTARTPEDMKLALERTIEESDGLIKIFNALLMIARAEAGSASGTLGEVEMSEIVADLAEMYEPVAEEAGLSLSLGDNPRAIVWGNRELLGQAVANLIDNAVKYGRPADATSGPAAISISARLVGEGLEVVVADRGEGIPEAERDRVLDRFVRLEKSRALPGSGLGLSLVAAIARLHHGDIRLEDNKPGLRVVFRLPLHTS
ncbi:MAG: HAMP domain-containing protein [Proteobacteria bacterium]|nr:HAMP domain-containing protein [Pseudomonadota bacterium]